MKSELADECNYIREASFMKAFGSPDFLGNDPRFKVPWVWDGSTSTVLVMERVSGISVGEADVAHLSEEDRNDASLDLMYSYHLPNTHFCRYRLGSLNFASKNFSNSGQCRPIPTGQTSFGIPLATG